VSWVRGGPTNLLHAPLRSAGPRKLLLCNLTLTSGGCGTCVDAEDSTFLFLKFLVDLDDVDADAAADDEEEEEEEEEEEDDEEDDDEEVEVEEAPPAAVAATAVFCFLF
jgi:hypothetical protein